MFTIEYVIKPTMYVQPIIPCITYGLALIIPCVFLATIIPCSTYDLAPIIPCVTHARARAYRYH